MDSIRLMVTTDGGGAQAAGLPIPGATVLVDRGTGALERLTTDGTGAVSLRPDGVVAYHVLYGGGANPWRLYTIATGALGPITLGGNGFQSDGAMTVSVPAASMQAFDLTIPGRCGGLAADGLPIPLQYEPVCEGATVHALCFATPDFNTWKYLDLGTIKLAAGTTVTATGAYLAQPQYKIALTGVPANVSATAAVYAHAQLDLMSMQHDDNTSGITIATSGTTTTVTRPAAPGGNMVLASLSPPTAAGIAFGGASERYIPATFSAAAPFTATVDVSTMLPPFLDIELESKTGLTWTGGAGGTITVVDLDADDYHWNAYLGPTAQSLPFPVIPADIGFPATSSVSRFTLSKFDIPGKTAQDLTPQIDQLWHRWPSEPTLFGDGGAGQISAFFIRGLHP